MCRIRARARLCVWVYGSSSVVYEHDDDSDVVQWLFAHIYTSYFALDSFLCEFFVHFFFHRKRIECRDGTWNDVTRRWAMARTRIFLANRQKQEEDVPRVHALLAVTQLVTSFTHLLTHDMCELRVRVNSAHNHIQYFGTVCTALHVSIYTRSTLIYCIVNECKMLLVHIAFMVFFPRKLLLNGSRKYLSRAHCGRRSLWPSTHTHTHAQMHAES